jgi:hypothetical protein
MQRLTSSYPLRFHVPRHYICGDNLCGLVYIASGCLPFQALKRTLANPKFF